jgi:hypothetical protein
LVGFGVAIWGGLRVRSLLAGVPLAPHPDPRLLGSYGTIAGRCGSRQGGRSLLGLDGRLVGRGWVVVRGGRSSGWAWCGSCLAEWETRVGGDGVGRYCPVGGFAMSVWPLRLEGSCLACLGPSLLIHGACVLSGGGCPAFVGALSVARKGGWCSWTSGR